MALLLKQLLAYCMQSSEDIANLTSATADNESHNAFLMNFMETDEDQFNQVSIRLSVVETIEQLGIHDNTFFSRFDGLEGSQSHILLETIEHFFTSWQESSESHRAD